MRYFVLADIHGEYDAMIETLNENGFDEDNPNHTLITLGDIMDRGPKCLQVLDYVMGLERKIMIRGNHEDLLEELLTFRRNPIYIDEKNGTLDTICQLSTNYMRKKPSLDEALDNWRNTVIMARKTQALHYIDETIPFFELRDYIFVHAWMPTDEAGICFISNDREDWKSARWKNGYLETLARHFYIKTIVCGHKGCNYWNKEFLGIDSYMPFITKDVIALDGKSYIHHKVNCIVIDD